MIYEIENSKSFQTDNRREYLRLTKDRNYTNVRFNSKNGALSAIHKDHHFDKTEGIFGIKRGEYERISLNVLYKYGKSIVLESEQEIDGVSTPDGLLDWKKFEIKGIEGIGKRNIEYKIYEASRQGAETVVLYFHKEEVFSMQRIVDGYGAYMRNSKSKKITTLYYILGGKLYKYEK